MEEKNRCGIPKIKSTVKVASNQSNFTPALQSRNTSCPLLLMQKAIKITLTYYAMSRLKFLEVHQRNVQETVQCRIMERLQRNDWYVNRIDGIKTFYSIYQGFRFLFFSSIQLGTPLFQAKSSQQLMTNFMIYSATETDGRTSERPELIKCQEL